MMPLRVALPINSHSQHFGTTEFGIALASGFFIYFGIKTEIIWLFMLAATVSLWAWNRCRKRYRLITDVPTARIASVPQGYVEVSGLGEFIAGDQILSPLTQMPCLWFRYKVERISDGKSVLVDSGVSTSNFLLTEQGAKIVVDPDHAMVISKHFHSWQRGNEKLSEWVLLQQDTLYVLGEHTHSLAHGESMNLNKQTGEVLHLWKQDQAALKKQFDKNNDGVIDNEEWLHARQMAEQEALLGRVESMQEASSFIRKSKHHDLFLISNYPAKHLANRFRHASWMHLLAFLVAIILAGKI
jgi:hypothetical protein